MHINYYFLLTFDHYLIGTVFFGKSKIGSCQKSKCAHMRKICSSIPRMTFFGTKTRCLNKYWSLQKWSKWPEINYLAMRTKFMKHYALGLKSPSLVGGVCAWNLTMKDHFKKPLSFKLVTSAVFFTSFFPV